MIHLLKLPSDRASTVKTYFLTFWRLEVHGQGVTGLLSPEGLPLAGRWHLFPVSSQVPSSMGVCVLIPSPYRTPDWVRNHPNETPF